MSYKFLRMGQELDESVGDDNRIIRTYTLQYLAQSTINPDPSVLAVKQGIGLVTGQPLQDDPTATLRKIRIGRKKSIPPWCSWDIEIVFSTAARVPSTDSEDPTQARVKRHKRYREVTRYITEDLNKNMLVNSANVPVPGGIPVTDYFPVFTYERFLNAPSQGFHQAINANAFNGWPPGQLLCLINLEENYEGSWYFWKETVEMLADPLGWPNPYACCGLQQLINNKLTDCVNEYGKDSAESQPLYTQYWTTGTTPTALGLTPAPGTYDLNRQPGMQVQMSDRPQCVGFIPVQHYKPMAFENLGLTQFPAT